MSQLYYIVRYDLMALDPGSGAFDCWVVDILDVSGALIRRYCDSEAHAAWARICAHNAIAKWYVDAKRKETRCF